ncbi:MAG: hypothetical protein QOI55_2765, partial [Actinomycetota bacterium]|nr:hypothetical protein [Actinomycetota bacterium]
MSIESGNDEMQEMLGAYALDALEPIDRARVDSYLERSVAARAEVDELRETAAMLASTPAPTESAPPEIWDRIAQNIAEADEHLAPVVDLDQRHLQSRYGVPWKFAAPIAAAAAIIVALLGYQVVDLRNQVDHTAVVTAAQYREATKVPGAKQASLTANGASLARVVVLPDGTGYLVNDNLAPLDGKQTYQLWAMVGDPQKPTAISAGVLGNDPHAAAFKVSAPVVAFALTEEKAGGV